MPRVHGAWATGEARQGSFRNFFLSRPQVGSFVGVDDERLVDASVTIFAQIAGW
jgi:hypothetical protein